MISTKKQPRNEVFRFWDRVWDIEKARKLISKRKPFVSTEEIKHLWDMIGDDENDRSLWKPVEGGGKKFTGRIGMVYVNWKYARTMPKSRLKKPLIIAQIKDPAGKIRSFVIDGWHRIARAKLEGIERLPVSWLNPEETASIESQVQR